MGVGWLTPGVGQGRTCEWFFEFVEDVKDAPGRLIVGRVLGVVRQRGILKLRGPWGSGWVCARRRGFRSASRGVV